MDAEHAASNATTTKTNDADNVAEGTWFTAEDVAAIEANAAPPTLDEVLAKLMPSELRLDHATIIEFARSMGFEGDVPIDAVKKELARRAPKAAPKPKPEPVATSNLRQPVGSSFRVVYVRREGGKQRYVPFLTRSAAEAFAADLRKSYTVKKDDPRRKQKKGDVVPAAHSIRIDEGATTWHTSDDVTFPPIGGKS